MSTQTLRTCDRCTEHERGLGLVEIVVSMFLISLLAIAFAPLLVASIRSSNANTTVATATQLVNERMQLAHANGPSCSAVSSLAGTTGLTDPRGVAIAIATTVAACPAGVGTVRVESIATRSDTGAEVARSATLVFVE